MPKFYTLVIVPINQSKEICEKQISVFGSRGGQISPLMHIPLYYTILNGGQAEPFLTFNWTLQKQKQIFQKCICSRPTQGSCPGQCILLDYLLENLVQTYAASLNNRIEDSGR